MADEEDWEAFVRFHREHTVKAMAESAFVVSISPGDDFDVKFALEVGCAILLDKPIVAVVWPGRTIAPGLVKIAAEIVELEQDQDTEAGRLELTRKLMPVIERLRG